MRMVIAFLLFSILHPAWCLAQEAHSASQQLIQEGDHHWNLRAEDSKGSSADSKEIDQSISAYRQALTMDPESPAAHWRLMRALYFRGEYVTNNNLEKK